MVPRLASRSPLAMFAISRRNILFVFLVIFSFLLLASTRQGQIQQYIPSGKASNPYPHDLSHGELPGEPPDEGEKRWTGGNLTGPGPQYERFSDVERGLPQHNLDLPFPEGRSGRYVKFSSQVRGLGWNNVLNELLLCSHLAWRAKRAYVFQDYTWKPEYYPWRIPEWPWPQNPLTTLISGPTAGGPWEHGDDTPRSVRSDWFIQVCPPEDTEIIYTDIAKLTYSDTANAKEILDRWVKLLNNSPMRCVDIVSGPSAIDAFPQVFDLWVIGSERLLTLWPEFKASPVSRLLGASRLVQAAIEKHEHAFYPSTSRHLFAYDPYAHMMTIHVRRGDFLEACQRLANHNSTFYGWNLLPELPDPFEVPPTDFEVGTPAPPAHLQAFFERCLPSNEAILEKIKESKEAWEKNAPGRRLDVLFVMTNAKQSWIDEFKKGLEKSNAGWSAIVSTRDFELDFEQTGVNMAIDMELGRRAAVYIGNGWSSMTSNILHRRLVDGKEPLANRFW